MPSKDATSIRSSAIHHQSIHPSILKIINASCGQSVHKSQLWSLTPSTYLYIPPISNLSIHPSIYPSCCPTINVICDLSIRLNIYIFLLEIVHLSTNPSCGPATHPSIKKIYPSYSPSSHPCIPTAVHHPSNPVAVNPSAHLFIYPLIPAEGHPSIHLEIFIITDQ